MRDDEIEPYACGKLDVGDGHEIYWELCGHPDGKPAVVLHGGPGSGCAAWWRRLFDLERYKVLLWDQRGCGRSRPHAGATPVVDLSANTTHHLVADIERLREHVGVERWLVVGGSWGSTLALAYAERHPHAVKELVLFSVVTTTRPEVEWVTRHAGRFFPAEWERFAAGFDARDLAGLATAYNRLLLSPDPAVHEPAARRWCRWEDTHVRSRPTDPPDPRYDDPTFRLCFARLVTHYWSHAAWLEDGELLEHAHRLEGIPGTLVHGRMDLSAPLDIPFELAQAWPGSELIIVDDEGHRGGTAMNRAVVAAIDRHAKRP
jgi:proline iminopeptidase